MVEKIINQPSIDVLERRKKNQIKSITLKRRVQKDRIYRKRTKITQRCLKIIAKCFRKREISKFTGPSHQLERINASIEPISSKRSR